MFSVPWVLVVFEAEESKMWHLSAPLLQSGGEAPRAAEDGGGRGCSDIEVLGDFLVQRLFGSEGCPVKASLLRALLRT